MADGRHLELIRRDVDAWNDWREANPDIVPDLAGADLSRLHLEVANLAGARLAGASLVLANLRGADLHGADLTRANLVGARLMGVDFAGANLSGANLQTAEDLTEEQLEETLGDDATVLPEGLEHPRRWASVA